MNNHIKVRIEEEFQEIITATTKLSFPFLANEKEKEARIAIEKEHIDNLVDKIGRKYNISIDTAKYDRNRIWENAESTAMEKFLSLPKDLQMNSFALQEVMHEYAVNQIKVILQSLS